MKKVLTPILGALSLAAILASTGCSSLSYGQDEAMKNTTGDKLFPTPTYVSMKKSGTVEVFPGQAVWKGYPNMLYNTLNPDGTVLLATSPSDGTVTAFDTATGKQLAVIKCQKATKGIKISPDGKVAYASNEGSGTISVIDMGTFKVVNTIKVGSHVHNVRFTANGKLAYATLQGEQAIAVVDTKTQMLIKKIPTPGILGPHNVDLSKDESILYIRDVVGNVGVLALSSQKMLEVIKVGKGHGGIDVAPNGKYLSTGAIGDDHISVIDTKTLKVTNIKVGKGPHGVRSSADNKWIYVTVALGNTYVVVNAETLKVEKTIPAGKFPFWVSVKGNP